jgi:hypothetical protein
LSLRTFSLDSCHSRHAITVGQLIVHEDYIGTSLRRGGDSIVDGTDDAHHIDVFATVQEAPEALRQDLLIIDDEDANLWSILWFAGGDGRNNHLKCVI